MAHTQTHQAKYEKRKITIHNIHLESTGLGVLYFVILTTIEPNINVFYTQL